MFSSISAVLCTPDLVGKLRPLTDESYGLDLQYYINDNTTMLIGKRSGVPLRSAKVKLAKTKNIPIVDVEYFDKCLTAQEILPLSDYLLGEGRKEEKQNLTKSKELDEKTEDPMEIDHSTLIQNNVTIENQPKKPINNIKQQRREGWKEAKVFISSTFRDMHGERDYLTKFVFPELQDRCDKIRVHVNIVDLRWGVTEEEANNGAALELCLNKVDECRPFFIGLIGTRYGWVPEKYGISRSNDKYKWLTIGHAQGYSVTHLEMEYGALHPIAIEKSKPLIYIRDDSFLADVPREYVSDFLPESYHAEENLNLLKKQLFQANKIQMESYPCNWKGVIDGKPMTGNLDELGVNILESLWVQIQEEFPSSDLFDSPLQKQRDEHDHFIESHCHMFVGRNELLQEITQEALQTSYYNRKPCVIVGLPGSGKTSVVSAFARDMKNKFPPPYDNNSNSDSYYVISHFIGGSPGSTNVRLMLLRLVQEIWSIWELGDINSIPQDYSELEREFIRLITQPVEDEDHKIPLLIIIDAINQLDDVHTPWTLQWLPNHTKSKVSIILSTLKGKYWDNLQKSFAVDPLPVITVKELSKNESRSIVESRLRKHSKKLSSSQMELLLKKKDSNRPLYLTVACEELRVFGVFEQLESRIKQMAENVPELFVEVLKRLEKDYGKQLVSSCLSILASARNGLTETECKSILGIWSNSSVITKKSDLTLLPNKKWDPLKRGLKEYLSISGGDQSSDPRISFFHEQLLIAVKKAYLNDKTSTSSASSEINQSFHSLPLWQQSHFKLSEYFHVICDPNDDQLWNGDIRGLSELPYHLISAEKWKLAIDTITDLVFMESKISAKLTFDLLQDFIFLLTESNQNQILSNLSLDVDECKNYLQRAKEFHQFLKAKTYILHKRPQLTFSVALSFPEKSYPCMAANSRWNAGLESRTHIRWENKPKIPDPCIMTLSGHNMVIHSCCIHPTKPIIASVSHDLTVKIWNSDTGEQLASMVGHTRSIDCCCFSPCGNYVASCSWDKSVRVWDIHTFQEIHCFTGPSTPIHSCSFSVSGDTILSVDRKGMLYEFYLDQNAFNEKRWTVDHSLYSKSIQRVSTYRGKNPRGGSSARGATRGATRGTRSTTRGVTSRGATRGSNVRNVRGGGTRGRNVNAPAGTGRVSSTVFTGNNFFCYQLHSKPINQITVSPTGKYFAVACDDQTVSIWNTETKERVVHFMAHKKPVLCVNFSPDESILVTGSADNLIKLFDFRTLLFCGSTLKSDELIDDNSDLGYLYSFEGHADGVVSLCFNPEKYQLLSASHDNILILWDLETKEQIQWFLGHTGSVFQCSFTPKGDKFVSCSFDRSVKVWEPTNDENIDAINKDLHTGRILGVSYSHDGKRIASASRDKTAKIWNIADKSTIDSKVVTMSGHFSNIFDCCFSPKSNYLVTASRDSDARIWNANNGECIYKLKKHTGSVFGCAYSMDGNIVATAGEDKLVHLWSTINGEFLGSLYGHRDAVLCVAFSPDGEKIVTGSKDKTLKLWDAKTKRKLATFCGHLNSVSCCNFSPDCKKIISGGEDKLAIEWSAINAKRLATIQAHDDPVKGCCYSADGKRIITASTDSMVIMWDAISKREVCSFACLSRITSLDTSKLGSMFAVGDGSGMVYALRPVGDKVSDALESANEQGDN